MKSILSMLAGALVLCLAACTDATNEPAAENPVVAAPVPAGMVRGEVLEAMEAAGYSYVLLDTSEGQVWIAAQQATVAVGDLVQADTGMAMQDFTSRALGRSFDLIYFSSVFQNLSAGATPEGHPQIAMSAGNPSGSAPAAEDVTVEPVEEGRDIAWLYANKDALSGEAVTLRGKVVKYNPNILGSNFLHIQDGSGDAADGSNDVIVTTQADVAVGQTVVVSGKVVLEKDFGAGYSYPVLLEDAAITVE